MSIFDSLPRPNFPGTSVNQLQTVISDNLREVGWSARDAGSLPQRFTQLLDSLARVRPEMTGWVLAGIVADEFRYGGFEAGLAARTYGAQAFPSSWMLLRLSDGTGPGRIALGLQALPGELSPIEGRAVYELACRAGWALEALNADSTRKRLWLDGAMPADWVLQNVGVLREAYRLLGVSVANDFGAVVAALSGTEYDPFK